MALNWIGENILGNDYDDHEGGGGNDSGAGSGAGSGSGSDDWVMQGHNWRRAIWTECAELMNELDWKWWKNNLSLSTWVRPLLGRTP
mgnify:CR=1 FL=1